MNNKDKNIYGWWEDDKYYMIDKNLVINEIIEYYLNSNNFNGLPIYMMKNYDYEVLCE